MWALQLVWAVHDRVVKREGNSRGGLIVLNFSIGWISSLLAKYHPLTSLRNFNPKGAMAHYGLNVALPLLIDEDEENSLIGNDVLDAITTLSTNVQATTLPGLIESLKLLINDALVAATHLPLRRVSRQNDIGGMPRRSNRLVAKTSMRGPKPKVQAKKVLCKKLQVRGDLP